VGINAIFSFLVYAIINALTPGPGNILALNTMGNYGWKKGKKYLSESLPGTIAYRHYVHFLHMG